MALFLRKACEFVQKLLRTRNKKNGDDVLENVAQAGMASGDGNNEKPARVGTGSSSPLQPARLRAGERATQLIIGGTHQRPEDTKMGSSDPGIHIDASRRRSWRHGGTAKTTPSGMAQPSFAWPMVNRIWPRKPASREAVAGYSGKGVTNKSASVLNAKFLISGGLHRQELRVQKHTRIIEFSSVLPNPKFARKVPLAVANFGFGTLAGVAT